MKDECLICNAPLEYLEAIGEIGGPRCCKRDSYLSILSAIDFVKDYFGVQMERPDIICTHSAQNNQCIGERCPFSAVNHESPLVPGTGL